MKKIILALSVGLMITCFGLAIANAEDGSTASTSDMNQAVPAPAPLPDAGSQPAPVLTPAPTDANASPCKIKEDLSPEMVAKCAAAMASGDKAMLDGCCQ